MSPLKTGNRFDGFLLFLLFILIIYFAAGDSYRGFSSIEKECSEYTGKNQMSAFHKITLGIPVNINEESVEGLTAIPGIGRSLARTINDERIKRNGFRDINELKTLPGIGEKLFLKISPYVSI